MNPHRPLPLRSPMSAPIAFGDADGAVVAHAGRYARECVLTAFEMIGGVDRMADWADKNPDQFFTKLFPKVITKEVEVTASAGIEDLLAQLDRSPLPAAPAEPAVDADFEVVE